MIAVRELGSHEELREVVALQKTIWGFERCRPAAVPDDGGGDEDRRADCWGLLDATATG